MPTVFEQQIREALRSIGLRKEDFHRLDQIREHKVLQDVKRHFLINPEARHWCESLRYEFESIQMEQAYSRLGVLCPNEGKKVWFVPSGEEMVYDALPADIARLLGICPVFEYAIVDKKLKWMVVQSYDDKTYTVGEKAITNLRKVMSAE